MVVVATIQRRANQFAVGESFLFYGPYGWNGIGSILHGTTPFDTLFFAGHNTALLCLWVLKA
jgi:hypothetical protein